jgi:S-adenosylmethionine decarboxylase
MKREIKGYGPHLMLDLNNCDSEILNDLDECYQFLNDIPEKIGMTKITRPYVFRYEVSYENDDGITGVVIIAESHISLHTYPMKNFVFVDLFSCKPFDIEEAKNYVIAYFKSKAPKVHLQIRGEEFPDAVVINP